jgi:phage terminase large subunit-like protein
VEPVLRAVAAISSDVAAKSFGSIRKMIMRGLEEHDLR